jgi:hypothetical protein
MRTMLFSTLGLITVKILDYFFPSLKPYIMTIAVSSLITLIIVDSTVKRPMGKQFKELKQRVDELEKKLAYQTP